MKKTMFVLAFLFTFMGLAQAQEKRHDAVGLYAGFTNVTLPGDNIQGFNGQVQVKIVRFGDFRIEAAGDYAVFFPTDTVNIHTFQGGPQVAIDLADRRLTLFGRALFGTVTSFNDDETYAYAFGGGGDINVTRRFFLRGGYDRQFIRDAGQSFNRVTFGGGLKF